MLRRVNFMPNMPGYLKAQRSFNEQRPGTNAYTVKHLANRHANRPRAASAEPRLERPVTMSKKRPRNGISPNNAALINAMPNNPRTLTTLALQNDPKLMLNMSERSTRIGNKIM
jgi:hypothetical protein